VPAAHRPDHGLDVAGGAVQGQVEQHPLGGLRVGHRGARRHRRLGDRVDGGRVGGGDGRGDPGQGGGVAAGDPGDGPDLGVGEPARGERLTDAGQVL
jgi:hypothetical protein